MEFFRIHKTIPFMHYRHVLNLISLVSFIVAVFWIFTIRSFLWYSVIPSARWMSWFRPFREEDTLQRAFMEI